MLQNAKIWVRMLGPLRTVTREPVLNSKNWHRDLDLNKRHRLPTTSPHGNFSKENYLFYESFLICAMMGWIRYVSVVLNLWTKRVAGKYVYFSSHHHGFVTLIDDQRQVKIIEFWHQDWRQDLTDGLAVWLAYRLVYISLPWVRPIKQ